MPAQVNLNTSISYETAGVKLNLSLNSPASGDPAQFQLTVENSSNGQRVGFSHQACPSVHDFTRGYTRWLGTKGLRSDRGDDPGWT